MPYKPWSYAPVEYTRSQTAQRFRDRARALEETHARGTMTPAPVSQPALQQSGASGGGWLDKLGDLVPGPVKDVGSAALTVLDAPRKYVGAPAFGVVSGLTSAKREYDPNTGRWYRKTADFGDVLSSLGEAVQHPVRAYQKGGEATQEYLQDPNKSAAHRFAAQAISDPLTYLGPGAVKAGLRAAPAAVQASRGARWAANVLESPRAVAAGSVVGGAAGAQVGHELGGQQGEMIGGLAGSLAGGVGGARVHQARSLSQIAEDVTKMADRLGIAPKGAVPGAGMVQAEHPHADAYMEALGRHGIDFSIEGDGTIKITDPEHAAAVADDLESALTKGTMPGRRGGVGEDYDLSERPYVDAWGAGAGAAPPPPAGGAPPAPPTATPPPSPQAAATPPPKPREDMFRTTSRSETVQQAGEYLGSVKGKIDQVLRKAAAGLGAKRLDPNVVKDTEITPFVVRWRNRIQNLTNSYEGLADELWQRVDKSGIKVNMAADGEFRLPNGAAFGDMVELSTPEGRAAYAALSHEQQRAVDALSEFNDSLNANLRYHWGKDLPWDEEIARAYFPRLVVGKGGIEKAYVGDRRGLGTAGSFMKERVHATLDEGLANKIDYAHPQQAYRAMVRAKLRVAGDAYVTDSLKPLGKTSQQVKTAGGYTGFNYVALPPDVAPSLQGLFFPRETAERIMAGLNGKPAISIPGAKAINTVLTPLRAMGDISWYGQQGSAMLFHHPLRAQQGALAVIKSSLGDVGQYTSLIDKEATRGPGLQELISRGLHWVPGDVGEIEIGFRAGGLPAYKQIKNFSNETFGRYLNYQRFVFANDAWERATKMGLQGADFDREIQGALDSVNRMSGFTGRKPTSIESLGEFAPRFFSAAVEQTAAALTKGGLEGSMARGQIGRMLGFGALFVAGANAVRGYDTDFDPRSNNFLRLRNVGGLDVSPFGTYDTLFRAIAATAAGQSGEPLHPDVKAIWHLAESKMSPALKLAYEPFIKQSTYDGEPLDPLGSWQGAAKAVYEQAKSSQPFGVQNIITEGVEPAIEQRSVGPLLASLPGEAASAAGLSNRPVTPAEKRDFAREDVAKEMFGSTYADLPGTQKAQVNRDPRVAGHQAEADRNTLTREGDRSRALQATQGTAAKVNALSQELESGQISGNQFRDQYRILMAELRGSRDVLSAGGGKGELDGWFALYDKATKPDGTIDYDQLDVLQADYEAKHPGVQETLDKAIGTHDNPTVAQYREAQKLAKAYYELPAYRGMTTDQSRKASQALMAASDMVSFGQARNMKQALATIAREDPEARQLARRAQSLGPNRARKGFRIAHPLFAKFYSDIAG